MVRIVVILIFVCCWNTLRAQALLPQIDSLQKILASKIPDTTRSLVLAELAYRYYSIPDSTFVIAKRGLNLATKIGFAHGIADNQFSLGISYIYTSDFLKALELNLRSLSYHQKHNEILDLARCYLMLGVIHTKQSHVLEAIKDMKRSRNYFEQIGDIEGRIFCLNNLGYQYTTLHKFDSASLYLFEGLRVAKSHHRNLNLISLTGSLSELYLEKGDLTTAEDFVNQSIALNEGHDMLLQALNFNLLAKIQLRRNQLNDAMQSVRRALRIEASSSENEHEPTTYAIQSDIYAAQSDFSSALIAFRKSVALEKKIFSIQKEKEHLNMLHRFELEEKENQIKILERDNALAQMKMRLTQQEVGEQKLYLIGFVFMLLLIVGFMLRIYHESNWRKKYIKRLQQKNIEIETNASALDEANRKLAKLNENLQVHSQDVTSKIESYAFINSHKLRAPVASLMGLLHLMQEGAINEAESKYVQTALREQVSKLDAVVSEITRAIE